MTLTETELEAVHSICRGGSEEEIQMYLAYCASNKFNPLNREVDFIIYPNNKTGGHTVSIRPGHKGYIKNANRNPKHRGILSCDICENDNFIYEFKNNKINITHSFKGITDESRGGLIGAWATIFTKGYEPTTYVMTLNDYYNSDNDVWNKFPKRMCIKTAEIIGLQRNYPIETIEPMGEEREIIDVSNQIEAPEPKMKIGVMSQKLALSSAKPAKKTKRAKDPPKEIDSDFDDFADEGQDLFSVENKPAAEIIEKALDFVDAVEFHPEEENETFAIESEEPQTNEERLLACPLCNLKGHFNSTMNGYSCKNGHDWNGQSTVEKMREKYEPKTKIISQPSEGTWDTEDICIAGNHESDRVNQKTGNCYDCDHPKPKMFFEDEDTLSDEIKKLKGDDWFMSEKAKSKESEDFPLNYYRQAIKEYHPEGMKKMDELYDGYKKSKSRSDTLLGLYVDAANSYREQNKLSEISFDNRFCEKISKLFVNLIRIVQPVKDEGEEAIKKVIFESGMTSNEWAYAMLESRGYLK